MFRKEQYSCIICIEDILKDMEVNRKQNLLTQQQTEGMKLKMSHILRFSFCIHPLSRCD